MNLDSQNKASYDLPAVAAEYARQSHLQLAEETILRLLLPILPTARMLDLGVGGGRTTLHFAKWVREYVGVDYSESMIRECRRRFADYPAQVSFEVGDARSMKQFEGDSFDFILFSHNGIDYVTHEDRLKILREIRRVGKPGGWFCFSSHNLNWAANLFELHRLFSLNPRLAGQTAKRLTLRFIYNRRIRTAAVRRAQHLQFNDGAHHRRLCTYYIRPSEMLAQLEEGFTEVRIFSQNTGAEFRDETEWNIAEDAWLYYLCKAKS